MISLTSPMKIACMNFYQLRLSSAVTIFAFFPPLWWKAFIQWLISNIAFWEDKELEKSCQTLQKYHAIKEVSFLSLSIYWQRIVSTIASLEPSRQSIILISCLLSTTLGTVFIPQGNRLQLKIGVKFRQHP